MTRWIDPDPDLEFTPNPEFHPIIWRTLLCRGFADGPLLQAFLNPENYKPAPALDLPGISSAVKRIIDSLQAGEPICVWGDFDMDGQTSTTVLVQTLQALGANTSYHIPIRQNESHGVNIKNLARIISEGVKLVITCDTGISALKEVEYASSRGVDMVITDHHDLPPVLPKAAAIVNPKLLPENHPLSTLAGVGVAFKLAEELIARLQPVDLQPDTLLDLVAMGLVADLAVLRGDTRYLVQKGLAQLRETKRLGLKTVMDLAELSPGHLTEEHIGFMLGPRFNAIGRLGDANPMVELLTTNDASLARVLAVQLEGLNVERKLLCDQVFQAAEAQLHANPELLTQPVIILAHPLWPAGIVGIVASRIVERYHKPAILLTAPANEPVRGSARSIEGINITAAIAGQKDLLLGFGGHPMAAGLSLQPENLPEFRRKLAKTVREMLGDGDEKEAVLIIDGWLNLGETTLELAEQLELLAPFGPGNPKLTLASRNLTIKSSAKLGKNKEHLKITVSDENGTTRQVIWWDGGLEDSLPAKFDLAYSLRASDWHGSRQAQLEFVDFRTIETELPADTVKKLTVMDLRMIQNPLDHAQGQMLAENVLCWAEGAEKKRAGGQDRNELGRAETLLIWTTPSSRQELLKVLEKVHPEKVVVYAIDPGFDQPKSLLDRLAGLIHFALNNMGGKTNLSQLAAAIAQGETVARLGLEWLQSKGSVTVDLQSDGSLTLFPGQGSVDSTGSEKIMNKLAEVLEESRAFRKQFRERTVLDMQ